MSILDNLISSATPAQIKGILDLAGIDLAPFGKTAARANAALNAWIDRFDPKPKEAQSVDPIPSTPEPLKEGELRDHTGQVVVLADLIKAIQAQIQPPAPPAPIVRTCAGCLYCTPGTSMPTIPVDPTCASCWHDQSRPRYQPR